MALSCAATKGLLQDYLARDLPPSQRAMVDAHLLDCEDCRQELALLSVVISGLVTQPVIEPPAGFTQRVLAGLPARSRFILNPWWSLALAPVLAGAAYLLRAPLVAGLFRVAEWSGLTRVQLPAVPALTLGQIGLFGAAGAGVVLAAFGLGLAFCWRWYAGAR